MKVTEKEIEVVSSLAGLERYKYFIKRVADTEKMYSLKSMDENWAISEVDNARLFPLWSASEFVEKCKLSAWSGFMTVEINLEYFEEELLEFIHLNGMLLSIFPVGDNTGFVVDILELAKDLNEEMGKYGI